MSANYDPVEIIEGGEDIFEKHRNDLMEMFHEASFRDKWMQVREGLRQPVGSGANKWAKLQVLRLLSPISAVVVPVLLIAILVMLPKQTEVDRSYVVTIIDPTTDEIINEIQEVVVDKQLEYDPIHLDIYRPEIEQQPADVTKPPSKTTLQVSDMPSVALTKCSIQMNNIYSSRDPGAHAAAFNRYTGEGANGAIMRALRYLKKTQRADGSWGNNRVAMTSLSLLAYLAHGDTSSSAEFGSTVQSAITYILDAQQDDGHFAGRDEHDYTQPIAAYALAEAFAMTRIPSIKDAAIKAMRPIIEGQNPSGGFNYNLIPSTRDDSSYMAWCVQALKAAQMAGLSGDIPELEKCMKKSIAGFNKNYGERDGYGGFGYTSRGNGSSGMTGAGVLCLQFLGASNSAECRGAVNGLSNWKFNWDSPRPGSFLYYMYYTTQVKFHEGGQRWIEWNAQFKPGLIKNQNVISREESGYVDHLGRLQEIGSWLSPAKKEHNGGNSVMDTIMCTLMLEVYIRHLPTFMAKPKANAKDDFGVDTEDIPIEFGDCGVEWKQA